MKKYNCRHLKLKILLTKTLTDTIAYVTELHDTTQLFGVYLEYIIPYEHTPSSGVLIFSMYTATWSLLYTTLCRNNKLSSICCVCSGLEVKVTNK
ncbi:hypothetical protein AQUCO_04200131v1 [Aquilegia coerulea]|uniref:Uncharacterized protein n=1 Tax=Aquilegia coerulea TaxID=218851 RepID=A0A2G5CPE0_AQUCA|nr:hypothetical protein AQUCO_04200131v1 [Aquilegia coerulea]